MGLQQDLTDRVSEILKAGWVPRDGKVVPDTEDIALDGDAVKLDAVVLYADMVGSSDLVERYPSFFATEMYKSFLYCAARIIRACDGEITAYDGDRVMAVFASGAKNTSAASCALRINHAVKKTINPFVAVRYKDEAWYKTKPYAISHVVGIDVSTVHVAKTGIRGANDLVWVGRAANFAAKLSALRYKDYSSYFTKEVYDNLLPGTKKSWAAQGVWTELTSSGRTIYGSDWTSGVEESLPSS